MACCKIKAATGTRRSTPVLQWHKGAVLGVSRPAQPHCLTDVGSAGCQAPVCDLLLCWCKAQHPCLGNETVSICKDGCLQRAAGSASRRCSGQWEAHEGVPSVVVALAHSRHPQGPSTAVQQCSEPASCWQKLLSCCPPPQQPLAARKL